jgi:C-terminal processing protease CtpA/Prc
MTATAKKEAKTAQEKNAALHRREKEEAARADAMQAAASGATIHAVKHLDGKVYIRYSQIANNATNEYDLHSDDEPSESFRTALASLAPHVSRLVNHSSTEQLYQAAQIEVKGVNYKYHEDDNVHAGIVATRTLDNGRTMTLSTPLMPLASSDPEVAAHAREAAEALEAVLLEARLYLGGKRAQGNLFAGLDD